MPRTRGTIILTITTIDHRIMDFFESTVSCLFLMSALLLVIAAFVAHLMGAARRRQPDSGLVECHAADGSHPRPLYVSATLAQVDSQLRSLADDVNDVLPRQFRLIDRLIVEGDREIARLQRCLAAERVGSATVSRREPDVILFEEARPIENATPVLLRIERERFRRAA